MEGFWAEDAIVGEGGDGPTGGHHGDELVFAVGVTVIEKQLDGFGASLDVPRAVGLLVFEKEFDTVLEAGFGVDGSAVVAVVDLGEHEEGLAGSVGVAGHGGILCPTAVAALISPDGLSTSAGDVAIPIGLGDGFGEVEEIIAESVDTTEVMGGEAG